MNEDFELPVSFKGKEWLFPARLIHFGYGYKLEVEVEGVLLVFERDEERNWRAISDASTADKKISIELAKQVGQAIETLFST